MGDTKVVSPNFVAFTVRTNEQLEDALSRLSEMLGLSKQEVVKRAVLSMDEQLSHTERVKEIASEGMVRWAEAIDRLSQT